MAVPNWTGVFATSLRRIRAELRDPLTRNGYALLLNIAITSVLGFLYWIFAARAYTPAYLGLGAAALAIAQLLAGIAGQPSISNALTRFLPRAGPSATRLTVRAYAVAAFLGCVVSLLYVAATHLGFRLPVVLGHGWLAVILAVSVMGWCVFSLQDAVLTGTRQAIWVPLENGLYNLGKIGLLLALAPISQRYGIFASWIVPALVALVPVNLLIFRRILPRHASAGTRTPAVAPLRTMTRFVGGDYLGSIFMLATIDLLPVLVVTRLGAEANGFFYVPFMIVVALDLVTIYLGMALTVEGAHDDSRLRHLVASVLRRVCLFVVPAVAILLVFGPLVLRLYGPVYAAHSTGLLRLLALAVLVRVGRSLYVSLVRVHRQVSRIALTQGTVFVLTMGLAWWLMGRLGLLGIGVAVLVTEVLTAAVVIPVMLLTLARNKPTIAVTGAE